MFDKILRLRIGKIPKLMIFRTNGTTCVILIEQKTSYKIFSTYMAPFLYLRLSNVLYRNFESITAAHSSIDDTEATFSENWTNLKAKVQKGGK